MNSRLRSYTTTLRHFLLNRYLLISFIISKLVVVALVLAFYYTLDSVYSLNRWNRWYSGSVESVSIFLPFSNWDGQHYLLLADKGYTYSKMSQAFFPLFPTSIALFAIIFRNVYFSAFIANLLFSYLFLVFFYHYARNIISERDALFSTVLMLSFPSSFFLTVFYSEALSLFLLFGFLYFYNKRSHWSSVFMVLLPLARPQAVFILFGLVVALIWRIRARERIEYSYEFSNISAMFLGVTIYSLWMHSTTGSLFPFVERQNLFVFQNSIWYCANPLHFLKYIATPVEGFFAYNNALLDKVFILLFFFSIPIILKSKHPLIISLFIALVYFPASMGAGGSYIRHSLMAAPMFAITATSAIQRYRLLCAAVLFLVQVTFIFRFSLNAWVG